MNKAPFLWTYAVHFAGNDLPELFVGDDKDRPIYRTLQSRESFFKFSVPLVLPVISVAHSEEEGGTQKQEDSEPRHSEDKEPSTGAKGTKEEVRSSGYTGPLPLFLCLHEGSTRCTVKTGTY